MKNKFGESSAGAKNEGQKASSLAFLLYGDIIKLEKENEALSQILEVETERREKAEDEVVKLHKRLEECQVKKGGE